MKLANFVVGAALMFGAITPVAAATISGGNPVIARSYSDGYHNFSILDGNNPIDGTGNLTSWSIYASPDASAVSLLIYRHAGLGYTLVRSSGLETPAAAGLQTFALPSGFSVQAGDLLGLYFQGFGSTVFDFPTGGPMLYTDNDAGFGNATNFVGNSDRIYSVSVTGGVPEAATWMLMLIGFGGMGVALRSQRRAVQTAA